jgi:hypothetical protein
VNRHVVSDKVTLADKSVVLSPAVVPQVILDHGQDLSPTFATLRACGVIDEVLRDQLIDHASITSREPSEPFFNQFPRRPFHAASQESDFRFGH